MQYIAAIQPRQRVLAQEYLRPQALGHATHAVAQVTVILAGGVDIAAHHAVAKTVEIAGHPDQRLLPGAQGRAFGAVGQVGGADQRQPLHPLRGQAQDVLGNPATERETGQRKPRRRLVQHRVDQCIQLPVGGQVGNLAVGDIGQVLLLRLPQGGIVEQTGQQQQGQGHERRQGGSRLLCGAATTPVERPAAQRSVFQPAPVHRQADLHQG